MRPLFYRLYVWWMTARVNMGQWVFRLRLERRKEHLAQADLSYLNLSGTDLSGANLHKTNLSYADLTDVSLRDADLSGANLRGAKVTLAQLQQVKSLEGATLPNGERHRFS